MSITKQLLDNMYGHYMGKQNHLPVEINMGENSVTLFNHNEDDFTLQAAIAGSIRSNPRIKFETTADGGVIRMIVPLAAAARMSDDFLYGVFYLGVLKNAMLLEMGKKFNVDTYYYSFKFPNGGYFRDLDDVAGFEIRLYLDKKVNKETGVRS